MKPVKPIQHTHNLTVISNDTAALQDTTVGGVYAAEVCLFGGETHDGCVLVTEPFLALLDDVGDVCILRLGARDDILLQPVQGGADV